MKISVQVTGLIAVALLTSRFAAAKPIDLTQTDNLDSTSFLQQWSGSGTPLGAWTTVTDLQTQKSYVVPEELAMLLSDLFRGKIVIGQPKPKPTTVPEPGALGLIALGAGAVAFLARRRAMRRPAITA